jgi:opacity protein-like surface antigen
MKRIAIAAAAAFLVLGGSAQAQTMPQMSMSGLYGELGYTWMKIDAAGTTARPSAIRGVLGYGFHPYFAGEFMLAGGVSDDSKNGTVNGVPTTVNVDPRTMYGLFIKPKYNWNQTELFARLGWAHTNVKLKSENNNLVDSSQSDNDFAYGFGVNFHFNPRMYVGLDWMRYSNQSGHKVDGMTLGFGYHW